MIFGASGDLAARKLLPALYWLEAAQQLPDDVAIVGVMRRKLAKATLLETVQAHIGEGVDQAVMMRLGERLSVVQMDSADPKDYPKLAQSLAAIEQGSDAPTRLYYLSIPPTVAAPVIDALATSGLAKETGITTRLLLEKPFGFDLASAKELQAHLEKGFSEDQIYRIDHYLAKETSQNICQFRFRNPVVRALWNNQAIERIEIEASEAIGIEGRANFYEQTGALRDVLQSHLLGLMALVLMEQPQGIAVHDYHRSRLEILEAIGPIAPDQVGSAVVRGQYEGYRREVENSHSMVETFAALRLLVDTPRWQGVSVVLSAGKALASKRTEIRVYFQAVDGSNAPNMLTFRIQPDEGITLQLEAKQAGLTTDMTPIDLGYEYPADVLGRRPDGYERVLLDCIAGDQTNFLTGREVLSTWELLEPVLRAWERNDESTPLVPYASGSHGPSISAFLTTP